MKTPQELAEYKRAWRRERAAREDEPGTLEHQMREAIRGMVLQSGIAVYKIAEISGISHTVIYAIMNGKQPATAYAAERIAKGLGYRWTLGVEIVEA